MKIARKEDRERWRTMTVGATAIGACRLGKVKFSLQALKPSYTPIGRALDTAPDTVIHCTLRSVTDIQKGPPQERIIFIRL
jgi:hypothetical protein